VSFFVCCHLLLLMSVDLVCSVAWLQIQMYNSDGSSWRSLVSDESRYPVAPKTKTKIKNWNIDGKNKCCHFWSQWTFLLFVTVAFRQLLSSSCWAMTIDACCGQCRLCTAVGIRRKLDSNKESMDIHYFVYYIAHLIPSFPEAICCGSINSAP
jgi:hypothetical protein